MEENVVKYIWVKILFSRVNNFIDIEWLNYDDL